MKKVLRFLLTSFEVFLFLNVLIVGIMFTVASCHNIYMTEEVKDFISKGTFECEIDGVYYYKVIDETLNEETIQLNHDTGFLRLGKTGDFFLIPQSGMDFMPMFAEFVSYLFGGHAGMIVDDGNYTVEAMGGSADQSYVLQWPTDLHEEERTLIGMRVVGSTKEERAQAAKNAESLIGKPYNYTFVFDTQGKYYCTDLCHRVYSSEFGMNYQLDDNGFHVSCQDLFRSEQTQITFVKYNYNGNTYIYYAYNPNL